MQSDHAHYDLPCKRKWCPFCAERRRRQHLAHFTRNVFGHLPGLYAVTLTLDPKAVPTRDPVVYRRVLVGQVWMPFRKKLAKTCESDGAELTYLAAPERHGAGFWHLHGIVSCPIGGAAERMAEQWFQVGGGAVLAIEPIYGGERGLAMWIGYVLKQWFGRFAPRNARLLVTHGTGYGSAWAKSERRRHVAGLSESVFVPSPSWLEWKPSRVVRASYPVAAPELQLDRRTVRFVDAIEDTPYQLHTTVEEGGRRRYAVTERRWSTRDGQAQHVKLSEHPSKEAALAAAYERTARGDLA